MKPGLDDKVLAGWNGLMLAAFAEAARVLGRDDYLAVAQRNAEFLWAQMRDERGRMLRTWKDGHAKLNGYLEDYANVADGLLELYQTTFEPRWFAAARELTDSILEHFADPDGGFFDTSDDHETLIVRPKGAAGRRGPFGRRDGRGGAAAPGGLHRRWPLRRRGARRPRADARVDGARSSRLRAVAHARSTSRSPPSKSSQSWATSPEPLLAVARSGFRPHLVVACSASADDTGIELLAGREAVGGKATAYVCRGFSCQRPVTTPEELAALLGG